MILKLQHTGSWQRCLRIYCTCAAGLSTQGVCRHIAHWWQCVVFPGKPRVTFRVLHSPPGVSLPWTCKVLIDELLQPQGRLPALIPCHSLSCLGICTCHFFQLQCCSPEAVYTHSLLLCKCYLFRGRSLNPQPRLVPDYKISLHNVLFYNDTFHSC